MHRFSVKKIKFPRFFALICLLMFFLNTASIVYSAEEVAADNFSLYAEKYSAYLEETGGEESGVSNNDKITVAEFFGVSDGKEDLTNSDYIDDFYSRIPDDLKKELPRNGDDASYSDFGPNFFLGKIKKSLSEAVPLYGKAVATVLSLILLTSLIKRFAVSSGRGLSETVSALCVGAVCMSLLSTGLFAPNKTGEVLTALSEVSNAVLPTMVMMLCATGNVTAAALTGQNIAVFCAFLEYLFSRVLHPMICASAALCIAGSIMGEKTAFFLSSFFRKCVNLVIVFSMSFFVFVMALQTTFATASDTLGIKTVKFAVGSFVPLVGGAVSETVNAVGAGFTYIKNTCGGLALAIIFIIVIPPLVSLIISKIILSLLSSISGMVGVEGCEKTFTELSGITDCLIATTVSASVVFVLIIIFVINCGIRIGGG